MAGLKGQKGDHGPAGVGRRGPRGSPGVKGSQFYTPVEVNAMVLSTIERFIETTSEGAHQLQDGECCFYLLFSSYVNYTGRTS